MKFKAELGTRGQGFIMLRPTSSVKGNRRMFRRDIPRRNGHSSAIKNTDKERIEMENFNSEDRSTEDINTNPRTAVTEKITRVANMKVSKAPH